MPIYEYRCSTCDAHFELRRSAEQSGAPATCPQGHSARRVLSVFAAVGRSGAAGAAPAPAPAGGGCGAGCACAAAR